MGGKQQERQPPINQFDYVQRGLEADPSDSSYRLAEEYRRNRGLAETRQTGRELLTPRAVKAVFGKGRSTVARATGKGMVPISFRIHSSGAAGPAIPHVMLEDCIDYWGQPHEKALETLRTTAVLFGIDGQLWAILDASEFKVSKAGG